MSFQGEALWFSSSTLSPPAGQMLSSSAESNVSKHADFGHEPPSEGNAGAQGQGQGQGQEQGQGQQQQQQQQLPHSSPYNNYPSSSTEASNSPTTPRRPQEDPTASSTLVGSDSFVSSDFHETRPSLQSQRSSTERSRPSMSHDPLEAINEDSAGAAGRSRSESTDVAQTGARRPGDNAYAQAGGMPANYGDMSNGSSGFAAVSASGSAFSQMATPTMEEVIPTTFDEGMLRALCDMDCGMPLLFDRIKQSIVSCREASAFFKKRAAIEEEYARNMTKLARQTSEVYSMNDGKAGTFVNSWQSLMRTHESLGENRLRFASKLTEMSDELANLAKEVDKNRKQTRETGLRLEKNLSDAELGVEKARSRFDATAEDLERLLLLKSGESAKGGELQQGPGGKRTLGKAIGKGGLLFKNKNPTQILKQEEEIRARTSTASDAFRKEVLSTQAIRQEYFNLQLPRILRSLKESAEEIDNGTQYHLARYAFLYESTILGEGMAISPVGTDSGTGLKMVIESIDNRTDFKQYMQNYVVAHGREYRGPRREGPYEEGFLPPPSSGSLGKTAATKLPSARPIFGVDLATQMARDGVEVPPIIEKCAEAIEAVGTQSMGIYRLSGTTSKVQRLKAKFDTDWAAVDLMSDEAINDINIIAGCLKLWFRELPEPLMTHELYQGFIDAAKVENDRLRHIRLHERVNDLPDANYATLKYLMGHLDKIRAEEAVNQMSASNLAIVFGPTLLSPPQQEGSNGVPGGGVHLQDMSFQCRAIETILDKYREIFVDENE